jgi:hypothetical protein
LGCDPLIAGLARRLADPAAAMDQHAGDLDHSDAIYN